MLMTARGRQRDIGAGDDDNVDNNRMQDGDDDENCLLVTHRKVGSIGIKHIDHVDDEDSEP